MALVKFVKGTKPTDVSSLDASTIYFFENTQEIYLGSTPYGGDINDLAGQLSDLEEELEELQSALQSKADASTVEGLGTKITGIEADIEEIQGILGEITDLQAELDKKLDKTEFNSFKSTTETELGKKADKTEVAAVQEALADKANVSDLTDLENRVEIAEGTIATQGGKLTSLEQTVAGQATTLGEIAEQQTTQDGKIKKLEDWLGTYYTNKKDLETVLEEIVGGKLPENIIETVTGTNGIEATTTEGNVALKGVVDPTSDEYLTVGTNGFKLTLPETAETDYTVSVSTATTATTGYAKTYEIKQGAEGEEVVVGKIDIPKDLVLSSGSVVVDADDSHEGTWIKLVLNNDDVIWIAASDLVDTVSANNAEGAPVTITVTEGTKIGATLNNGSVTKTHLVAAVQTTLDHADEAYTALTWGTI